MEAVPGVQPWPRRTALQISESDRPGLVAAMTLPVAHDESM
ncbi:MAG: hypothetical protein WA949_09205 [Phormidesmis sp.]